MSSVAGIAEETDLASGRVAHRSTQILGLALMSAVMVLGAVISLVTGAAEAGAASAAASVLLLVTFLVWRFDRTWARIVGLIFTVIMLATLNFAVFGLFQPFSPIEFVSGLMSLVGFVFALAGGIVALRDKRKGRVGPTAGETRLRRSALGIIGLGAVVSVAGFFLTRHTVSAADAAAAEALDMRNYAFSPADLRVETGEKLLVHNSDAYVHDFAFDLISVKASVRPGSDALIDLSAASAGTYTYYCSLHSDGTSGMVGTITIGG
ncbi:MAG: cupredoxin domain-containing protein [Actinomycetota bacterium]